jgi:outer membrane protein assembly factor BamB
MEAFYAVAGDGTVRALNVQDGSDLVPPVKFLQANANVSGLMLVDSILYAATANNCGGVANGLFALDLTSPDKTVTAWKSNGGGSAGTLGPAAGVDGTLYMATTDGEYSPASYSDAVVALAPRTLALKDYFTPGKVAFGATPVVFPDGGKDWIVAAGKDGRFYVLDSGSLGGPDHHTPVYSTPKLSGDSTDYTAGALATWQDSAGVRWVLAPTAGPLSADVKFPASDGAVTNGAVVAFKVVAQNGKPTLQPAWVSRDMVSPSPPIIVNGIVFALATGEFHTSDAAMTAAQRAQRSTPAVLYALDAATGKAVWNSGNTITSFVHSAGLSSGNSQVYVSTYDSTLYAFGIPMER